MVLLKRNILLVLFGLVGFFASMSLLGEEPAEAIVSAEKEIQGLASVDFAEAYQLYTDKKYPESIRLFKAILHNSKEKPYHDLAQLYIIRANVMSGNHVLLETDCNRFLGRYPESAYTAEVVYVLGRYYFSVNAYEKTISEYSAFLNLNKDEEFEFRIPLTFWLGEAYLKLEKENQASTNYLYVIAEAPMEDPVGWRAAAQARMSELAQKHQKEIPAEEVSGEAKNPVMQEDADLLRENAVGEDFEIVEAPALPELEEPVDLAVDQALPLTDPGLETEADDTIAALPEDLPSMDEDLPVAEEVLPETAEDLPVIDDVAEVVTPTEILPDTAELEKLKNDLIRIQKENENIKEMVKMKERLMDLKLYYMEQRVQK